MIVETRDAVYTYVIDDPPRDLTVPDTATWVLDPVPGKPEAKPTQALLTLTTCQDLFRSPDRSVGFGHLTSTKNQEVEAMEDDTAQLIELIKELAVVHGQVTLSSGQEADYYVDMRRVTLDGAAAPIVGRVMRSWSRTGSSRPSAG